MRAKRPDRLFPPTKETNGGTALRSRDTSHDQYDVRDYQNPDAGLALTKPNNAKGNAKAKKSPHVPRLLPLRHSFATLGLLFHRVPGRPG
jgi:hypothetical protein